MPYVTCNKKRYMRKADPDLIAQSLISYYREIGPNLANEIEKSLNFEKYMTKWNILQPAYPLSVNKLKDVFFHYI